MKAKSLLLGVLVLSSVAHANYKRQDSRLFQKIKNIYRAVTWLHLTAYLERFGAAQLDELYSSSKYKGFELWTTYFYTTNSCFDDEKNRLTFWVRRSNDNEKDLNPITNEFISDLKTISGVVNARRSKLSNGEIIITLNKETYDKVREKRLFIY